MTLSVRADEHVRRVYVTSLRSTGYEVEWVDAAYEPGIPDTQHLERSENSGCVILSNDVDFARLHHDYDHAGIILYSDQLLPISAFVRGIRRIERFIPDETLRQNVVWLDAWVD